MKGDVFSALQLIRQLNANVKHLIEKTPLFKGIMGLLRKYESYLKQHKAIDFAEMIHRAKGYIERDKYTPQWKHILVDEFQDTSDMQANFIKLLRDKCDGSHLMCVGDDWQSIYRFQGGNIDLITNFENHFGYAYQVALDKTFRFNQNVQDISSAFVTKNPRQTKKQMKAFSPVIDVSVHLVNREYATGGDVSISIEKGIFNTVNKILNMITKKHIGKNTPSVMILGRTNKALADVQGIKCRNIDIRCMTIHKSKGLEADYVIVVGLKENSFPSSMKDGILTAYLLPPMESFNFAEERRLLYVALTRCKHKVWLVCENGTQKSEFTDEIQKIKKAYCNLVSMKH